MSPPPYFHLENSRLRSFIHVRTFYSGFETIKTPSPPYLIFVDNSNFAGYD